MPAQLGKIWVFDESKLDEALQRYQQASLAAYPQHEEKIRLTMAAVNDFLHSTHADKLRMTVSTAAEQSAGELQ